MMSALYIGSSGMQALSKGLNTISNNVANVNTIAYKQQSMVFQDLISQSLALGAPHTEYTNQRGMGAVAAIDRTLWKEGGFESSNSVTDLAINGKGYFRVSDESGDFYTRAGNFHIDDEGFLVNPTGLQLTGVPWQNGAPTNAQEAIQLDMKKTLPAKPSTSVQAQLSVGKATADKSIDVANPFFSMLSSWDGDVTGGVPVNEAGSIKDAISSGKYNSAVPLRVVDANGKIQDVTLYLDNATTVGGQTVCEYMIAANPLDVLPANGVPQKDTGLLMMGTLTFNSTGQLADMTAFTPTGAAGTNTDLANWKPAPLVNGFPAFTTSFGGGAAQTISIDLGLGCSEWRNMPASAADVGTDSTLLGGMNSPTRSALSSYLDAGSTASAVRTVSNDGHVEGFFTNMEITEKGTVRMHYSNSQSQDVYSIPLFRFTSEDGLRREGGNLFSATDESGVTEWGLATTSNYGGILSTQIETSNVDLPTEMVNLITTQRGFQMNSKTVTIADQMLQKAMEIKRQ